MKKTKAKKQVNTKPTSPLSAYDDPEFMHSKDARTVRILAEFMEPGFRLKKYGVQDTIVFFGSARTINKKEAKANLNKLLKQKATPKKISAAKASLIMADYYEDAVKLSKRISLWAKEQKIPLAICSGGGPGMMEAANKGAKLAKAASIGLNINLPFEQSPNKYISDHLNFEFHYFFLRKYWFLYHAKALIVFPGGFGTLDELMEVLTLIQTEKVKKDMTILLYGKEFWTKAINFEYLAEMGMIGKEDLKLFKITDSVDEAFLTVTSKLEKMLYRKNKSRKELPPSMLL